MDKPVAKINSRDDWDNLIKNRGELRWIDGSNIANWNVIDNTGAHFPIYILQEELGGVYYSYDADRWRRVKNQTILKRAWKKS